MKFQTQSPKLRLANHNHSSPYATVPPLQHSSSFEENIATSTEFDPPESDVCAQNSTICGPNAECQNVAGSYQVGNLLKNS